MYISSLSTTGSLNDASNWPLNGRDCRRMYSNDKCDMCDAHIVWNMITFASYFSWIWSLPDCLINKPFSSLLIMLSSARQFPFDPIHMKSLIELHLASFPVLRIWIAFSPLSSGSAASCIVHFYNPFQEEQQHSQGTDSERRGERCAVQSRIDTESDVVCDVWWVCTCIYW